MSVGTLGSWLKGGGGGMWSARCQAALIACGIDPDNFGTFEDRAEAQSQLRDAYRQERTRQAAQTPPPADAGRDHETCCPRYARKTSGTCLCHYSSSPRVYDELEQLGMQEPPDGMGRPGGWLAAASESGHMSQNALYQGWGDAKREDGACGNVPPPNANPRTASDCGAYGYNGEEAFCADHHGKAMGYGAVPSHGLHGAVSDSESNHARDLTERYGEGGRVPFEEIERGASDSATSTANSGRTNPRNPDVPGATASDAGRLEVIDHRRQRLAHQMRSNAARRGDTGLVEDIDAMSEPNGAGGRRATDEAEETAAECIKDKWRQSLDDMRHDAINNKSTVGQYINRVNEQRERDGLEPLPPFTEMSQREQHNFLRYAEVDQRQRELAAQGASGGPVDSVSGGGSRAERQRRCEEYQGNWLAQRQAHQGGELPPPSGRAPTATRRDTRPTTSHGVPSRGAV